MNEFFWVFSRRIMKIFNNKLKVSFWMKANFWRKHSSETPPHNECVYSFLCVYERSFFQNTSSANTNMTVFLIWQKYPPPPWNLPDYLCLQWSPQCQSFTPSTSRLPWPKYFRDIVHAYCDISVYLASIILPPIGSFCTFALMFPGLFVATLLFWRMPNTELKTQ